MTKRMLAVAGLALGMFGVAGAQAPAGAPAGSNGICKDGTYSTAASKQGACRGHKGVQAWYSADAAASTKGAGASTKGANGAAASSMPAPKPAAAAAVPAPKPATAAPAAMPAAAAPASSASGAGAGKRAGPAANAAAKTQAVGGGPGLVWVNTESNVYHCNGDVFYGKTKAGAYMSEADAKAKGARGERGKSCAGK